MNNTKVEQINQLQLKRETMIKTLEFKLNPSTEQKAILNEWFDIQQYVWNVSLGLLHQSNDFSAYNKADKTSHPCCPIYRDKRWFKDDNGDRQYIPRSYIANKKGIMSCPIPDYYQEPQINQWRSLNGKRNDDLTKWWKYRDLADKRDNRNNRIYADWVKTCPYKFMAGTVAKLHVSWREFKNFSRPDQRQPKFKNKKYPLTSIHYADHLNFKGDYISIHRSIGKMKVKGLEQRLGKAIKVCQGYTITRKATGFYLYQSVEMPAKQIKPSTLTAGFDLGTVHLLIDDFGKMTTNQRYGRQASQKMERLQRKASRQYELNGKSKNWGKTQRKIARLHEKITRQRKGYNHKLSTFITRKFDTVVFEDLHIQNMTKRAKPKPNEHGGFDPNGQAAKSGLNKSLLDASWGSLKTLIKEKAANQGKQVIEVPAAGTSQTCFACGHRAAENRLTQAVFKCVACGHEDNADINAAKNIKALGMKMDRALHDGNSKRG